MLQAVLEELIPHFEDFQTASLAGCEKLVRLPYDDLQFKYRRLQREAMLNAFFTQLPSKLGSFERREDSYRANRLVYYSAEHNAELIFRRKGSVSFMAAQKRRELDAQIPLFQIAGEPHDSNPPRQIALIWEFPELDEDHEPTDPIMLVLRLAKIGAKVDHRQWESTAVLDAETEFMPKTTTFDPNVSEWDIDDEEDDTQAERK